jgi:hypothetical protein
MELFVLGAAPSRGDQRHGRDERIRNSSKVTCATAGAETGIGDLEPQQRYPFTSNNLRPLTVQTGSRLLDIGYRISGMGFSLLT